jgi:cell division protein FtsW
MTKTIKKGEKVENKTPKPEKKKLPPKEEQPISLFIKGKHFDFMFFTTVIVILILGLIMILSSSAPYALRTEGDSYYYFTKQVIFAAIGVVLMLIVSKFDYRILNSRIAWLVYIFGVRNNVTCISAWNWC